MEEKNKILFVTHYGDLYGANLSLLGLINELKGKYNITVLCNRKGTFVDCLEKNNIDYLVCNYFNCAIDANSSHILFRKMRKRIYRIINYRMIWLKYFKNNRYDLVHTNSSMTDIGHWISRKYQIPHVWHIREYGEADYSLLQIDNKKSIAKRYLQSQFVVAISKSIEDYIHSINKQINTKVIYNGLPIREKYNKSYCMDNVINFCIVGVVSKQKNQIEAVRAINKLVSDGYRNVKLHIIGGDFQKETDFIEEYIETNQLSAFVKIWGYSDAVDLLLEHMDVGIVTSVKEAFGRVTVEFMSNYMPVIGTNCGGTKELIEEGINGYLYDCGNTDQLVYEMERLVNDSSLIGKMGMNARIRSESFTIYDTAQKINELYLSVLK